MSAAINGKNHDQGACQSNQSLCKSDQSLLAIFYRAVFSVLFANICASKTFFAQERTLTTFGTSTRLNFMPLRADESIETHPIYTTPNIFLQFYFIYFLLLHLQLFLRLPSFSSVHLSFLHIAAQMRSMIIENSVCRVCCFR